jgi:hypothetical protein
MKVREFHQDTHVEILGQPQRRFPPVSNLFRIYSRHPVVISIKKAVNRHS